MQKITFPPSREEEGMEHFWNFDCIHIKTAKLKRNWFCYVLYMRVF